MPESHGRPDYDYLVQYFQNQLTPEELADEKLGIHYKDNGYEFIY